MSNPTSEPAWPVEGEPKNKSSDSVPVRRSAALHPWIGFTLRLAVYLAALAGSGWWIVASARTNAAVIGSVVQAAATIVLAAVGIEALLANRQLVSGNRALVAAAEQEAQASRAQAAASARSVDEAAKATAEGRRQWALGRVPFVVADRPDFQNADDGRVEIVVPVRNLGPGIALDVRLTLDRQDRVNEPFLPYSEQLSTVVPVLGADDRAFDKVRMGVRGLVQMEYASWRRHAEASHGFVGIGDPPDDLLVPHVLRVRLTWMSTQGVRAELTHIWHTRNVNRIDSLTWRLERLELHPGGEAEESLIVAAGE